MHQEEKPHKCIVEGCDKAFKTPAELSRHAFRHTGEKPHKCDQCDKAFIRYDDLKRHYRIHTGEAPTTSEQNIIMENLHHGKSTWLDYSTRNVPLLNSVLHNVGR